MTGPTRFTFGTSPLGAWGQSCALVWHRRLPTQRRNTDGFRPVALPGSAPAATDTGLHPRPGTSSVIAPRSVCTHRPRLPSLCTPVRGMGADLRAGDSGVYTPIHSHSLQHLCDRLLAPCSTILKLAIPLFGLLLQVIQLNGLLRIGPTSSLRRPQVPLSPHGTPLPVMGHR